MDAAVETKTQPRPNANARQDELPPQASAKLIALQGQATDARDAAQSAHVRLGDLQQQLGYGDRPANAPGIELEVARLHQVREVQNQRHGELASLCAHIRQWLTKVPPGTIFELVKPLEAKPRKDETLVQAIDRTRDEIASMRQHLRVIQVAPLPKSDLKAAARTYIREMAAAGRPHLSGSGSGISVVFPESNSYTSLTLKSVFQMQCWLFPEKLITVLEKEIDLLPTPSLSLSAKEKTKRLSELSSNLDHLERMEEALVTQAIKAGQDVLRRANASALAVLDVKIKNKTERVRAA